MLDKLRPAVLITREEVQDWRDRLTVAPISSTVRGLSVEVAVGPKNGLVHDSVINCDDIMTVERSEVGALIGFLLDSQEEALAEAVVSAFALEI